jgi:hypothetical protein
VPVVGPGAVSNLSDRKYIRAAIVEFPPQVLMAAGTKDGEEWWRCFAWNLINNRSARARTDMTSDRHRDWLTFFFSRKKRAILP